MSASLVVLLPVILLGIVTTLCFAGCGFSGPNLPVFTTYSDTTVLANPSVVAYWPLGEAADNVPAVDRTANPDNGQYIDPATTPAIYPWPASTLEDPPGPSVQSAAAPGSIAFAQPGIVAGDTVQPGNDPPSERPASW